MTEQRRRHRYFNKTGPCRPHMHYMLPPEDRLTNASLHRYINDELYWVLHAPRQTGKTTFLQSWMRELNSSGDKYGPQGVVACYVSVEACQGISDAGKAGAIIINAIRKWADTFDLTMPPDPDSSITAEYYITNILQQWAAMVAPKKLVILFDEVDVLEGPAMISFLRQMRDGFVGRSPGKFPVSIALVGMRDLKDYLAGSKGGVPVNPGSPFNIKQDSASLCNFNRQDINKLIGQHITETGQGFTDAALDRIWHYTSGQPWLVNALCDLVTQNIVPFDTRQTVTEKHIDIAKEKLIKSRATHIDSLSHRLMEPRVKKIVEPIITGDSDPDMAKGDDFNLCLDLGLVSFGEDGTVGIANAIYREVLARELSYGMQVAIPAPEYRWKNEDGSLDMDSLMVEFQKFWRRHADVWEEKADYTEAFPHLLVMAFMQRIVNAGGTIEREYAAGRGRVDLCVHFGGRQNIIEIKLVHPADGRETTILEGLQQINRYADKTGADTCHLIIFDRRPEYREKSWEERLGWEEHPMPTAGPTAAKMDGHGMETADAAEKHTDSDEKSGRLITVLWC